MMSWLFGKKKHKESPTDSTEEETTSPEQGDDYIFIEKQGDSTQGDTRARDGSNYPSSGLYPHIGGIPPYPESLPANVPKENQQMDTVHYLSAVPFKLCKQLDHTMNDNFDIDQLRLSEIVSFIERIENQNYDYDFALENSVIIELDSMNNE